MKHKQRSHAYPCNWRSSHRVLVVMMTVILTGSIAGCPSGKGTSRLGGNRCIDRNEDIHQDLLLKVWASLSSPDEFESANALEESVQRLDLWIHQIDTPADWQPDPMIEALSENLRGLPMMESLTSLEFTYREPNHDGTALRETLLARDVADWAGGDSIDPVTQAVRLFDWTIRNIQLEGDTPVDTERIHQRPLETLLIGRGSATDRCWVFLLLARQRGLDAAVLALPDPQDPKGDGFDPWLLGVRDGEDIYLFDPTLGLPVPAPDGTTLDAEGQLSIVPATLAQTAADDAILRRLDLDEDRPYPVTAEAVESVIALLEASPSYLSRRMALLRASIGGEDRTELTIRPTDQAERFTACRHVSDARIWEHPYRMLVQEREQGDARVRAITTATISLQFTPVGQGRFFHLRGRFDESPGAVEFYQAARPSTDDLAQARMPEEQRNLLFRAKLDASYWLGMIALEQNNPASAIDYLETRTLRFLPDNRWTSGARYNLARAHELAGAPSKAITLYMSDLRSPAFHGNVLRARWLASLTSTTPVPSPAETTTDTSLLPALPDEGELPGIEPPEPSPPTEETSPVARP